MREAAADGSPVADRGMRDMGDRFRQQRRVRGDFGDFRRSTWRVSAPMRRVPSRDRNAAQLSEFADIDDQFRRNQAQIHRRHQALAAGQHLGPVPVRGEQLQRVRNAGCACVAESRGFHCRDLPGRLFGVFFRIRRW